jgi:acyl carrier protein
MQTTEELTHEVRAHIIKSLNLQDVASESFNENTILFGEGLGLDSIDALELIVMMDRNYGIKFEDPKVARKVFINVRTIVEYIQQNRR